MICSKCQNTARPPAPTSLPVEDNKANNPAPEFKIPLYLRVLMAFNNLDLYGIFTKLGLFLIFFSVFSLLGILAFSQIKILSDNFKNIALKPPFEISPSGPSGPSLSPSPSPTSEPQSVPTDKPTPASSPPPSPSPSPSRLTSDSPSPSPSPSHSTNPSPSSNPPPSPSSPSTPNQGRFDKFAKYLENDNPIVFETMCQKAEATANALTSKYRPEYPEPPKNLVEFRMVMNISGTAKISEVVDNPDLPKVVCLFHHPYYRNDYEVQVHPETYALLSEDLPGASRLSGDYALSSKTSLRAITENAEKELNLQRKNFKAFIAQLRRSCTAEFRPDILEGAKIWDIVIWTTDNYSAGGQHHLCFDAMSRSVLGKATY